MFVLKSGRALVEFWPKAASTAFSNGALTYANGSGYIIPADSTSGDHVGIIMQEIATTDTDYASTTKVAIMIPKDDAVFEADVASTTELTAAMVGNGYDLTDSLQVNVGAQAKKVVTCVGFISATKGLFKINASVQNVDVATT